MSDVSAKNEYLEQVMDEQVQLENVLKRRAPMAQAQGRVMSSPRPPAAATPAPGASTASAFELLSGPAVDVRITGFWRWQNVIVPPNAYVVHTRRGEPEPIHCGLGISFRFNPLTDSFLVVPAAMQTIVINARSIVRERQGILIQAYVQWIIQDFKTAYRKLDFTDPVDPMRVVNVQLREQAEAAIKDKVSTLSVDEVLSDKQPIIRELTARLRHVAEGEAGGEGLGLKIVTVQIKEAIVSSAKLWETLQRPFRAERAKEARLAELANEAVVFKREAEENQARATAEIETQAEIAARRAKTEAGAFDREQAERARRARIEAEHLAAMTAFEGERLEKQAELSRKKLELELAERRLREDADHRTELLGLERDVARRKLENDVSPAALQGKLVELLPEIAGKMPKPQELRTIQFGTDGMASLVAGIQQIVEAVRGPKA